MNAAQIVSQATCLAVESLSEDSKLGFMPEWDSLAQLMIIGKLEELVQRDLTPEEFEMSSSLKGIQAILEE